MDRQTDGQIVLYHICLKSVLNHLVKQSLNLNSQLATPIFFFGIGLFVLPRLLESVRERKKRVETAKRLAHILKLNAV